MVHCYPVDGRLFQAQLLAAAEGRIEARFIAIDLPGFGASPFPPQSPAAFTVDELAELVCSIVAELNLEQVVLGGVAVGGSVAVRAATQMMDRVNGLVLVSNRSGTDSPANRARRTESAQRVLAHGSAAVARDLANAALAPTASLAIRHLVEKMIADADPRAIAALVRAIGERPDLRPDIERFRGPILFVAGANDPFSPPAQVRELAAYAAMPQIVVLNGVGHMAPAEAPEQFGDAVGQFLASVL
jgi:pimeloyl-ACP methyl ester carboxylesterase